MIVPLPPDPTRKLTDRILRDIAESRMIAATEAVQQGIDEVQRFLVERFPWPPPAHREMNQVFIRPHGADDWQHLGYTDSAGIVGVDYGFAPVREVVVWPRRYGKSALTAEFTFEGPFAFAAAARAMCEPLFAELLVRRDHTVHRLAHELGLDVRAARHQFDLVQHILETSGIGDGYGRLTIPQPVRPSIAPPAVPRLVTVYPFAYLAAPPGAPRPLVLRSIPRSMPALPG